MNSDVLIVRESGFAVALAILVCLIILGAVLPSLSGAFRWLAVVWMVFILSLIMVLLLVASFVTSFSPYGICGKSLFRSWSFAWWQIETWGLDCFPNSECSIYFEVKGENKRRYVQALRDDVIVQVKAYFERHCGSPRS